ncbi:proteasome inhibitor PI31 subunit [Anopheles ziemanni]|uniref:proteasome inhibitor PI31 subunit n=1 Tax=Anopheles coustani TaxID=139045 RepID=UPI00265B00AA|nr:proteasome inhibitor PI31 subunit [Anopheles coustani]XP_058168351.1 proteasome inhibitor PI31 subunit [Anopheles ziemanni]
MADPDLYGLEMLWKLEKGNVSTKSDLLIVFVHWVLTKNSFRCVGVGDDKTLNDDIERSELLPEGWNESHESYNLRYAIGTELYILHGTVSKDTMICNLLQAKTLNVSNIAFNLKEAVCGINGDSINTLLKDINAQVSLVKNNLLNPIVGGTPTTAGTQTEAQQGASSSVPSNIPPPGGNRVQQNPYYMPPRIPVGRGDLDPLGRLGGGMLLDGPRNAFPNFGPVPQPRPRFDPFGPNMNRFNRPGPDNDHLPPPGYDDMFM